MPAGLDPKGLQNNGAPTQTLALLPTSPAVDAIPAASCTDINNNPLTTDQRGIAHPQGSACDIIYVNRLEGFAPGTIAAVIETLC
jgi:hypothetical protein